MNADITEIIEDREPIKDRELNADISETKKARKL